MHIASQFGCNQPPLIGLCKLVLSQLLIVRTVVVAAPAGILALVGSLTAHHTITLGQGNSLQGSGEPHGIKSKEKKGVETAARPDELASMT